MRPAGAHGRSLVVPVVGLAVLSGCSLLADFDGLTGGHASSDVTVEADGGDGSSAVGSPAPKIVVSNLRGVWSTPNTIAWEWDVTGTKDAFGGYELAVSRVDGLGAKTWTSEDNAELGRYLLPNPNGNEDVVTATRTDGLEPDTMYAATLIAIDSAGRRTVSNEARLATTVALSRKLVLFEDERPPGYPLPFNLAVTAGCGVGGSACLRYDPSKDPECSEYEGTRCYQNLRWQDMDLDLSELTQSSLDQVAYLEFSIASTAASSDVSYWSDTWLTFSVTGLSAPYAFHPWTYRPSPTYRTVQVPLRVLRRQERVTLAVATSGVKSFNIGGAWSKTGHVDLDDVVIHY